MTGSTDDCVLGTDQPMRGGVQSTESGYVTAEGPLRDANEHRSWRETVMRGRGEPH